MCTWSRERGSILLALVCLAALGCGEGKPKVTIQPAEQLPIREFTIDGMPDELEAVTLVYSPAEEEWADLYFEEQIERDKAGNFVAFVPVHPAGVAEGGTLNLEIEGLDHRPLELTVKPAPPAPGTTREYVAGAARVSRSLIESWGAPVDEVLRLLDEDPASLPVPILFPALAVYFLDGPEQETSLVSAVDQAGSLLDGEFIDLDATDRLLALSELPAAMQQAETAAAELAATPITRTLQQAAGTGPTAVSVLFPEPPEGLAHTDDQPPYFFLGGAHARPIIGYLGVADALVRDLALRVAGRVGKPKLPQEEPSWFGAALFEEAGEQLSAMRTAAAPVLWKVRITTAGELDTYMRMRARLVRELEGPMQKAARTETIFAMSFVPSLITELIDLANWWLDLSLRSNLGTLPSRLDPIELTTVSPTEFVEDDTRKGTWAAEVKAHSETFVINWADVIGFAEKLWKYWNKLFPDQPRDLAPDDFNTSADNVLDDTEKLGRTQSKTRDELLREKTGYEPTGLEQPDRGPGMLAVDKQRGLKARARLEERKKLEELADPDQLPVKDPGYLPPDQPPVNKSPVKPYAPQNPEYASEESRSKAREWARRRKIEDNEAATDEIREEAKEWAQKRENERIGEDLAAWEEARKKEQQRLVEEARREEIRSGPSLLQEAYGERPPPLGHGEPDGIDPYVMGSLKKLLKKLLVMKPLKGKGVVQYGPYEWGPIPLKDPELVEAEIVARAGVRPCARILAEQGQPYEAAAAGECMLKIKTRDGAFGGNFAWPGQGAARHLGSVSGDAQLRVDSIQVTVQQVEPQTQPVATGQHVLLEAEVRNALDEGIEWRFTRGELSSDDGTQLVWKAPKELKDEETGKKICRDIFAIEAESMTETGPREGRQPPRIGRTTITVEEPTELEIIPGEAVLLPQETLQFRYEGAEEAEVRWSADKPGEIDAKTGLFKAPAKNGAYEVTAKVAGKGEDSCAEDAVIVRVSSCSWTVVFDGKTFVSGPGDDASFTGVPGGFTIGLSQEDGGYVGLTGNEMEGTAVGGNMGASGNEQYGSFYGYEDPKLPISLFLDRNGGGVVAGRASGTVKVLNPSTGGRRLAQFSAEFVIASDPDAPSVSPLDNLGNMEKMLGRLPMVPPGTLSDEQQEQLKQLESVTSPEQLGQEHLQDKAMLGGLTILSCEVPNP